MWDSGGASSLILNPGIRVRYAVRLAQLPVTKRRTGCAGVTKMYRAAKQRTVAGYRVI